MVPGRIVLRDPVPDCRHIHKRPVDLVNAPMDIVLACAAVI